MRPACIRDAHLLHCICDRKMHSDNLQAAITGVPMRIKSIRAGRSRPGLRPQHMAGLQLVADMCGGDLAGCVVEAAAIELYPGLLRGGRFLADTKTAGSCMLMVQVRLCASCVTAQSRLAGGRTGVSTPL